MWGTCEIVNFSWLLFSTLLIGQNLLTQKKHALKEECKCILLRKRPSCRFMQSLCKNEKFRKVSYVGKALLPHNKRNCYPPYPHHYLRHFSTAIFSETKLVTPIFFFIFGVSTLSTNSRGEMKKISP